VRDDLAALLPRVAIAAVDATTNDELDAPVLIGTEAVLHRITPADRVGLVAYLELDQELLAPRARAAEQALWLVVRGARLLATESGGVSPGRALLLQTRLPEHEVVQAARTSDPWLVTDAERARRRALGYPPFGGLAELSGVAAAVGAACDALRVAEGVTVLGPVVLGPVVRPGTGEAAQSRALLHAPTLPQLCDALAAPGIDAARALGRLRIDVDPRRI
jgi:primosomal protein N' (replication factor Y)